MCSSNGPERTGASTGRNSNELRRDSDVAPVDDETEPEVLLCDAVLARLDDDALGRTRRCRALLSSLPAPRLRGDQNAPSPDVDADSTDDAGLAERSDVELRLGLTPSAVAGRDTSMLALRHSTIHRGTVSGGLA